MAKGDNHKRGSGGNGTDGRKNKYQNSNYYKRQTNARHVYPNGPEPGPDFHQNDGPEVDPESKAPGTRQRQFNILADRVPYMIRATPFSFNSEIRYRVRFNGSAEHVFTWDSSVRQLRAIDDDSCTVPVSLEEAISGKLQSKI